MGSKNLRFQGKVYSSYYQLEKVMNIPRRTIQYRHETKGIPLDQVPNFVADPPEKRFGRKLYFPKVDQQEQPFAMQEELDKIINYPKAPDFYVGDDKKREDESKARYIEWLKDAPETLLKRELKIYEGDLQQLINRENSRYFYTTSLHDNEKNRVKQRISIQKKVLSERKIVE